MWKLKKKQLIMMFIIRVYCYYTSNILIIQNASLHNIVIYFSYLL